MKKEIEVKEENALAELPSDDELLSVIKKVKYGSITNETKENGKENYLRFPNDV